MSEFRLLAVRPLPGCSKKYSKVLQKGRIYPFYQGYKFLNENGLPVTNGEKIIAVVMPKVVTNELYDVTTADGHKLHLDVSAVAGKNGSGKSSMIELLFGSIYLLSVCEDISEDSPKKLNRHIEKLSKAIEILNKNWKNGLKELNKLINDYNELFKNGKSELSFLKLAGNLSNSELAVKELKGLLDNTIIQQQNFKSRLDEVYEMASDFRVELIYQYGKHVYSMRLEPEEGKPSYKLYIIGRKGSVTDNDARLFHKEIPFSAVAKRHFFYTIAINYSHYALNSKHMGKWIDTIFHKNDGYKAPLVVNPMRHDGNFDINKETSLGKYRLLSNLIMQFLMSESKKIMLTDQLSIKKVTFTLNRAKVENDILKVDEGLQGSEKEKQIMKDFFYVFFDDEDFANRLGQKDEIVDLLLNYILKKLEDLKKYDGLGSFSLEENGKYGKTRTYFKTLLEEKSHVTYKLRQAVYFLAQSVGNKNSNPIRLWSSEIDNKSPVVFEVTLEDLLAWTGEGVGWDIIARLPPSIFDIDFVLGDKNDDPSKLSDLSSGEQQMINTLQTVIYHINNLQSVHYSGLPRVPYKSINIVFDEIELYFHPAYQRSFIRRLRETMQLMHFGENSTITNLNIIFLTHSPFILSDIPKENISLLRIDEKTGRSVPSAPETQTFAANINDLLADSFFLEGTLMGEFAEDKVNTLVESVRNHEDLSPAQLKILDLIGDSYLRNSLRYFLNRGNDQN